MISTLTLKFGRNPGSVGEPISLSPVTVFVGPNNSGKSKVLSEIEQYCRRAEMDTSTVLLKELTFADRTPQEAQDAIAHITQKPGPNDVISPDHIFVGSHLARHHVDRATITSIVQNPASNPGYFCQLFLTHKTLMLNGHSRITLVGDQQAGDLQQPPVNSFQALFQDNPKRTEVRRIVYDAFGQYFVIDPTRIGFLRIRLSACAPVNELEECGIHSDAVKFHSIAQLIDRASDGVKAFTGIVTEVIAGDPQVLLIDEPEAFLHPSLASKLGMELSRAAQANDKRIFVSTHSPAFVMGCIQSGVPVNIVRLTYRTGVATARVLPSGDILRLMRHPLLRSTGVLSALFFEFIVVTESDADRAFYQEINERLLRFTTDWGIPHCLFINAQNKQTMHTIVRPLRQLGIPAVGIVDVDVLKEGGANWANILKCATVPELLHGSLGTMRADVKNAMEKTTKDMKRDGGVGVLDKGGAEAAQNLLKQLADYGIFVVAGGELESWLKPLGATGHGPAWLVDVFEKMGEDPESKGYTRPSNDDVWLFVKKIRDWLLDTERKGIPD